MISLKEARQKLEAAKRDLLDGINPAAKKKTAEVPAGLTFEALAKDYLTLKNGSLSDRTIRSITIRADKHLYPYLGDRLIAEITPQEILSVLRRV
jgi:hypothetical protein